MTKSETAKVWIDQDLCTGDGLCTELAPDIFEMGDDGLAYVKDENGVYDGENLPAGAKGLAQFAMGDFETVFEASEECPGECIFIEDNDGNNIGPYAPDN